MVAIAVRMRAAGRKKILVREGDCDILSTERM